MHNLDYVPSWLDGATTLLQKLNKCIKKVEELSDDVSKFTGLTVDDILKLVEGSETIVVDLNETNDKVEIHLDYSVISKLDRAILTPKDMLLEDSIPVVKTNNSVYYKPFTDFNARHYSVYLQSKQSNEQFRFNIYANRDISNLNELKTMLDEIPIPVGYNVLVYNICSAMYYSGSGNYESVIIQYSRDNNGVSGLKASRSPSGPFLSNLFDTNIYGAQFIKG